MAQQVTQSVVSSIWPCTTREQIDEAQWDLFDNHGVAAHVFAIPAVLGTPDQVFLQVVTQVGVVQVDLGNTLVYNAVSGWQSMTDADLAAAGLPTSGS